MFHKKNLRGRRSNVKMFYEKAFSVHPSGQHPSSHGSNVQEISLCHPETLSLFHVLSVLQLFFCWLPPVFRCLAVINILSSVQPCDSRCVLRDAWKYGCLLRFLEVKCQSVGFFCSGFSLIDLSPCTDPCAVLVTQKYCTVTTA